jgi:hypothetical protein
MHVITLDPEHEYEDLTNNLGGCFIDLNVGQIYHQCAEPKVWVTMPRQRMTRLTHLNASPKSVSTFIP